MALNLLIFPFSYLSANPPHFINFICLALPCYCECTGHMHPSQNLFRRNSIELRTTIEPQLPASVSPQSEYPPPCPRITTEAELIAAVKSPAIKDFLRFIRALDRAVVGLESKSVASVSQAVESLVSVLDKLSDWVDEIPPEVHSLRYGNPAFRTWFARLEEEGKGLVEGVLREAGVGVEAAEGVAPYFQEAFGNRTRIDYGTGHETCFVAFLFCLAKLGVLMEGDCAAVVLKVFDRYLRLMRKLQTTYWLEPAGSHGVWGLEDYQFLPFLWGAAQLIDHPLVQPKSIHNEEIVRDMAQDFMYLECIQFIKQVKKGPLWETSPYLCDISAVPTWSKVNSGLLKMYQAEVLGKLPIMQHFLFGTLIPYPDPESE